MIFPAYGRAVYGVIFNFPAELERLGAERPAAPVLHLRPRNTWSVPGASIRMPSDATELKMGGTIGAVIGLVPNQVGGFVVANDVSIPHESYFRPAIRQRCRDGFCIIGSEMSDRMPAEIRISINGELRRRAGFTDLVRPIARLITDISEFLTLRPGDVLLIGESPDAPLARVGDRVRVEADGLASIENEVLPE